MMNNQRIAVVGLGYVGLPLARLFSTKYSVVGFDINQERVEELMQGIDTTREIESDLLRQSLVNDSKFQGPGLYCTSSIEELKDIDFYIVTVPTPVDKNNKPILTPLIKASETVGKLIKPGSIVIYESTVYPGATEEDCVPILEEHSGLKYNEDFFVGYSPERINPGDKEHTVEKIKKVTSGSTPDVAKQVDDLYASVITAGTHLAPSIKVAEAAKVIENSQRDINIAFVNELAKIFNLLDIDTSDVLEAASTKWNFLPFRPGLVGGHCIGVDPYYLAQKAMEVGYHPELILAGRRMNDGMGSYVANQVMKLMLKQGIPVKDSNILVLGFTFKENCPDVRNTRVIDVIENLSDLGAQVTTFDPLANIEEVNQEFGLILEPQMPEKQFDAVILAVAHQQFSEMNLKDFVKDNGVIYDVKGVIDKDLITSRL